MIEVMGTVDTVKIFNTKMNKAELVARVGRLLRSGPEDEVSMLWLSYNACYKISDFPVCSIDAVDVMTSLSGDEWKVILNTVVA